MISSQATATAKASDGHADAIRVLKIARDSAVNARTKAINQLKAILVGASPQLRESLTGLGRQTHDPPLRGTVRTRPGRHRGRQDPGLHLAAAGGPHPTLKTEADELHKRIRSLVDEHAPQLLECRGIGPDSAAALLIAAGDNPERLTHEGSYAALCGVSP